MTTELTVDYVKHQSWALMVKQQSESGLSVAQWCEENSLKTKCFYYRRRSDRIKGVMFEGDGFLLLYRTKRSDRLLTTSLRGQKKKTLIIPFS